MAKQYNFDNIYSVASLFVRSKMYELLTNENDYVNIAFNFEELEARCFLKSIAKTDEYVTKEVRDFLLSAIDNVDYSINVINVPDYKEFFTLLYEYANKYKDDGRENAIATNVEFSFNYLWIRMTPDDFNDVIGFLRKNVAMLEDKTFEKYKDEVSIDDSSFYKDQIIFAHSSRAYLYDESNNEMRFVISDGKNNYCLPIIRYDIYKQNGVKTCQIGSIQDKYNNSN